MKRRTLIAGAIASLFAPVTSFARGGIFKGDPGRWDPMGAWVDAATPSVINLTWDQPMSAAGLGMVEFVVNGRAIPPERVSMQGSYVGIALVPDDLAPRRLSYRQP